MTPTTEEKVWSTLKAPLHLVLLDEDEDLYTIDEFKEMVACGALVDYDGMGNWATATHYQNGPWIYPSSIGITNPPEWATHVVWYNK